MISPQKKENKITPHLHIAFSCFSCARFSLKKIAPNSQMPYLQLTDAGSITVQQKDVKGAITHTNKGVVRRMFVVNEPFTQASTQR